MQGNRILFGVLGVGLIWSVAASGAVTPTTPTTFYVPVDLSNATARQVYWQTETTPCNGNNVAGPDGLEGTADDILPASTVFILDPGCAVTSSDPGAVFNVDLAKEAELGLPPGSISNGLLSDFTSDGTTATVTLPAAVWGPVLKESVDTPGLVTVTPGTASDYVFTIDIASGDVTSFSWTAAANTVLGGAALSITPLPGTTANWYTSEATPAPGASGATTWACRAPPPPPLPALGRPKNTPLPDPGSLGTCPGTEWEVEGARNASCTGPAQPDACCTGVGTGTCVGTTNRSLTTTNAAYDAVAGTLFANASSAVLAITPRAWGPLDGRLSEVPEPDALLLGASALVALGVVGRRRDAS